MKKVILLWMAAIALFWLSSCATQQPTWKLAKKGYGCDNVRNTAGW